MCLLCDPGMVCSSGVRCSLWCDPGSRGPSGDQSLLCCYGEGRLVGSQWCDPGCVLSQVSHYLWCDPGCVLILGGLIYMCH